MKPEVFLDPSCDEWASFYSSEDQEQENKLLAIKSKIGTRITTSLLIFGAYQIAKSVLWRRGHFATFFYRTRFINVIPLILYNSFQVLSFGSLIQKAGLEQYYSKRVKF